jgi:serine/threonine protein kinase
MNKISQSRERRSSSNTKTPKKSKKQKNSNQGINVDLNNFEMSQTVGMGSFGRVRLCRHKKSGHVYVMKILKKYEIIRQKQVDHLFYEYRILSIMNHPYIVELKGVNALDPKYLYLILEYVPGGELFSLLRNSVSFPVDQAKFYVAHIVTIFEYLHEKKIVYRDLKPENILINKNGYLKLTDFGFAKVIEGKTYTLCGTPEYLAPEIILNKGHGMPVDWWTMGILLYEMLVGIDPFSDDDPMMIYQKIIKGKIHYPKGIDKDGKSLIKHLLEADTTKRYGCLKNGVRDIVNHRFFDDFNWREFVFSRMKAPYIPEIKGEGDASCFGTYPDSDTEAQEVPKEEDPFLEW